MGNAAIRVWAGAALAVGLAGGLAACARPVAQAPAAPAAPAPLLARADLFGEAVRDNAQLSPRGDRVAYIAVRDGAPNIWVVSVAAMDEPRPVTDDQAIGVRDYRWAYDNATLLYLHDERGNGASRLYAVSASADGEAGALTPAGVRAEVIGLSPNDPAGVVVALYQRDPAWADVYRIDINTGARTLLYRNLNSASARGFAGFVVDRDNHLRLGLRTLADGGTELFSRARDGSWASLFTIPFEDVNASRPIGFDADGRSFLMLDSTGRDRAALVRVDAASGVKTVLGESQRADVVDVWLNPGTGAAEAYAADYLRPDWRALDADAQSDLEFFELQLEGKVSVVSRSIDDAHWIIVEDSPTAAPRSYLYDRSNRDDRRLTLLFRHRPALDQAPLQPMIPVEIEARDGLTLVSYLTLPIGADANGDARPETPQPLVIAPHSAPWGRDAYGYDPLHQWLANRGYAVLSVNFRGSSGFGKAFQNAGNRQWGGRMQEDLLDAVQWAVENGIAAPDQVAIMGSSFGGYAALSGLAFTPERFRCAVSFAGPASLNSVLEAAPVYESAYRDALTLRVGDPSDAAGRQALRDQSPLSRVGQIQKPLLMALGGRDRGAARAESDQIAQNLSARRVPLIYLNYPDEGPVFLRQDNRISFFAVAEHFLGECLGGRVEPVGAALQGAGVEALEGANRAPGLSAFAVARAAGPAPPPPPAPEDDPRVLAPPLEQRSTPPAPANEN